MIKHRPVELVTGEKKKAKGAEKNTNTRRTVEFWVERRHTSVEFLCEYPRHRASARHSLLHSTSAGDGMKIHARIALMSCVGHGG